MIVRKVTSNFTDWWLCIQLVAQISCKPLYNFHVPSSCILCVDILDIIKGDFSVFIFHMRVLLFRHFLGTVNFGISALSLADSQNVNNVPWIKNLLFTGCLFYFISPSVLRLQFYALYGKRQEVLPFVLQIETCQRDKRQHFSDEKVLTKVN